MGLGLYICKRISNIFGGDTSVDSEFGKGSTFSFVFELSEQIEIKHTSSAILNPFYVNCKIIIDLKDNTRQQRFNEPIDEDPTPRQEIN